jgi:RNA polymerase sigma-70 factor (ECF subfamily)
MNSSPATGMPTLPSTSALEDQAWIKETLAGDENAFAKLIAKYKDRFFGLACNILGSRSEAEDVLQDAFLQAFRNLAGFRNHSQFSTWFYSIVLNRSRNRLRRNKILNCTSLDVSLHPYSDMPVSEPMDRRPSLDAQTGRKLDVEAIESAAEKLPVHYRSVFVMHYFQNLSVETIGETLGWPEGTVKVYLHRARKLLYKQLKESKSTSHPFLTPAVARVIEMAGAVC